MKARRRAGSCAPQSRLGRWGRHGARSVLCLLGLVLWPAMGGAQEPVDSLRPYAYQLRQSESFAQGWGWDTSLSLGLGLDGKGRATMASIGRAGTMWAADPQFYAVGLTLEVGGVAKLAGGAEFEWSHLDGWFGNVGVGYGLQRAFTNHVTAGFRFAGVQYQHRFFAGRPYHAAFVVLRLPFGLWWSIKRSSVPAQQRPAAQSKRAGQLQLSPVEHSH